jgi:hypothetical protein
MRAILYRILISGTKWPSCPLLSSNSRVLTSCAYKHFSLPASILPSPFSINHRRLSYPAVAEIASNVSKVNE